MPVGIAPGVKSAANPGPPDEYRLQQQAQPPHDRMRTKTFIDATINLHKINMNRQKSNQHQHYPVGRPTPRCSKDHPGCQQYFRNSCCGINKFLLLLQVWRKYGIVKTRMQEMVDTGTQV